MNLEALLDTVPAYARDLKLNFSAVVRQNTELTEQQLWGTVVACAAASRNRTLLDAIVEEAKGKLSAQAVEAAKGAAAILSMNNIFYRFQHLAVNKKYETMRAGLRMNFLRQHGVDPLDFELWALAVSAVNGCGKCIDAHERVLLQKEFSEEKILAAIRVASTIYGLAVVFDAEEPKGDLVGAPVNTDAYSTTTI
ncbi:alkylhydroperoxidase, AhpD family [Candidatus Koribacter versatilis Ellin345]|uniref:Alkyl hydroperoxide reductase AhpD n=1 Tax=Koribacter versatilis (strain Ellin345) TaxID=204669 RepID=AHPD_KORVE|nr:carboxymuconolactone decarboxylase family protein [Candidatus Koribacter versatilis]Q1IJ49.1 RecName: Full=Alkyl hydroperoxide reductase AhpD; AltName: Full=Alkylhydroperoxidase AhpD [Candidatus Koribacter versatilis Ellin345]ABF43101.1 alkylhydroperoxidase, AhpD family [Candidatus Koribacter versatilis Ellin345]